jgi:Glycosyl transferase family 21
MLGDWRLAAQEATVGNGQFMLIRRTALNAVGGLEPIRNEAIDDVAIVAKMALGGSRVGFFRGLDSLRIRMYRGVRPTIQGWRRNLGGLLGKRTGVVIAVLASLLGPVLLMTTSLVFHAWGSLLVLWLCGSGSSMLFRSGSRHSPLPGLLYPVDAVMLALVIMLGSADSRRGVLAAWKGREMRL